MPLRSDGLPHTDDYLVGRGILYFATLDANGKPMGWRDLGNCPSFKLTATMTKIDHKSSRAGLATIDKTIITEQKFDMGVELEEVTNYENLAFALSGALANPQPLNASVAGFAAQTIYTAVTLGRWYDIFDPATGRRAYDLDTGNLVLKKLAGAVLLVENTDYTLDLIMGRAFLKSTAVNIAAGDDLQATLTADATAKTLTRVWGLTTTPVAGALKFIGANAANADKQDEVQVHKIQLGLEGDLGLISDTVAKFSLKGTAQQNVQADANSPYFSITTHDNNNAALQP